MNGWDVQVYLVHTKDKGFKGIFLIGRIVEFIRFFLHDTEY